MLQGDMLCKPQVKALQLEEGTPEYDAVLWERFLKKWYADHPDTEDGATHESDILRLTKDNIDPHFVWWMSGYKQYSAYMKNAIRLRALGEDVSFTKTQKTVMNATYPRDLRVKFPDQWHAA